MSEFAGCGAPPRTTAHRDPDAYIGEGEVGSRSSRLPLAQHVDQTAPQEKQRDAHDAGEHGEGLASDTRALVFSMSESGGGEREGERQRARERSREGERERERGRARALNEKSNPNPSPWTHVTSPSQCVCTRGARA